MPTISLCTDSVIRRGEQSLPRESPLAAFTVLITEKNNKCLTFFFLLIQKTPGLVDDHNSAHTPLICGDFHHTSPNLHQIILWHHKLRPHLTAFPFLLPGLDLPRIERPLVQMVFLLLLLRNETEKRSQGGLEINAFNWSDQCGPFISTLWPSCCLFSVYDHVYVTHSMLAFLLHDVLGVLQHLFLPQVKEVRGISVKLQGLLPIIPVENYKIYTPELYLSVSYFMLCCVNMCK